MMESPNDPDRIALQLTQRLFANGRELNHTLLNFIDFKCAFRHNKDERKRKREKLRGRHMGWEWVYITLAPRKMKNHAIPCWENKYF